MSSGEAAAVVAIIGMVFNYLGVTGIDSTTITGAVNGVIALVVFGAAIFSWWKHHSATA